MKLRIVLIIIFFITVYSNHSFAQVRDTLKNQIKFSPIRTLDPVNPGLELSYERLFTKYFSAQLSGACLTDALKLTDYMSYEGYRVSIEGKYYISRRRMAQPYLAGELVFAHTNFKFQEEDFNTPGTNYITYNIDKNMTILNAKFGFVLMAEPVVIDICAGLGLKFKNIYYIGDKMQEAYFPNFYDVTNEEGSHFTFSVPMNIKLGVAF